MRPGISVLRPFVLLVFLLGITASSFAIDERYAAKPLKGSAGQIKKDSIIAVADTVHITPALKPLQLTNHLRNVVTFKIDEFSNLALPANFAVTLKVKIYYGREVMINGVLTDVDDSTSILDLAINYNRGGFYQSKAIYTFTGGYYSRVKIFDVQVTSGVLSQFEGALMLENEIQVNREFQFSCTNNAIQTINTNTSTVSTKGELTVHWAKDRAADEYDLEWTYIGKSAYANYYKANGVDFDPAKVFANNATRVSITSEKYLIPLLYEDTGKLFYRVRPVQIRSSGQRLEAEWSSSYAQGLGQFDFIGHDSLRNWQATTSFAEEGKRKSVVQYFDGSFRSRQTVTKDNTTDTTVVAETLYDHQGRPSIQVMPAPSLNSIIKFTPNFNTADNGIEYTKDLYDGLLTAQICDSNAAAMGTNSGASQYYSPNNPLVNKDFHKYIPDAQKYPFAQTQYTPDNTGRIAIQGGVGKHFQIGGPTPDSTHDTRYYYSTPDQKELDALFGTEVGNASHYFKNMVRDANGQYSVSYVDMHGRTIATALAGTPAQELDSLIYRNTKVVTKKLLDPNNNIVKGTVIESSKSIEVTKEGPVRFRYSLQPDSISIEACDASLICYDCLYDLEITISNDECNNAIFGGSPYKITRTNVQLTPPPYDIACNAIAFPTVDEQLTLTPGIYLVTKRLTINQRAFDYYRDSVFLQRNLCKTLDDFVREQLDIYRGLLDCYPSCQSCVENLGDWDDFHAEYMSALGIVATDTSKYRAMAWRAYQQKQKECEELCNGTAMHHSIRQQMLEDITPPYGQYANPEEIDPHSIFFKFFLQRPQYKRIIEYHDANGQPDSILVSDGRYLRPNHPDVTNEEFIRNFRSTWADSLLRLHPEYCKLKEFEKLNASHLWDERFKNTDTYQAAVDSGFLNPGNFLSSIVPTGTIFQYKSAHRDPFFTDLMADHGGPVVLSYKIRMQDSLKRRWNDGGDVSMWAMATMMAHCPAGDASCREAYKSNSVAFVVPVDCSGELDVAWRYFREMYLQEKRELVYKWVQAQTTNCPAIPISPYHSLNFPDPNLNLTNPPSDLPDNPAQGADSLNAFYENNCQAYVLQWYKELAPCGFSDTDTAAIFPLLREVCRQGTDMDHPFGSSTVKPSSTYTYRSFDDVIRHFRPATDPNCNGYLITAPLPFDPRPIYYDKPVFTKPDSCECETIDSYYQEYQAYGSTDANFAAYLLRTTGVNISNGVLDTLRMSCSGLIDCQFLAQPIILPAILQCGSGKVCVDCGEVNAAYAKYLERFPTAIPTRDNDDTTQQKKNRLFERYMNAQFGFTKASWEYLQFLDSCQGFYAEFNCDTLNEMLSDFAEMRASMFDTVRLDAGGCDTAHWKLNHGGSLYTIPYPLNQVFVNGVAKLPVEYSPASSGINFDYYSPYCIDGNGFTFEVKIKIPDNAILNNYLGAKNRLDIYDFDRAGIGIGFGQTDPVVRTLSYPHSAWQDHSYPLVSFNSFRVIKVVYTNDIAKIYLDNQFVTQVQVGSKMTRLRGWSIGGFSHRTELEYVKLYDGSGNLRYHEEFDGCSTLTKPSFPRYIADGYCNAKFVDYFNRKFNSSYTISQIDSIYWQHCGVRVNVCAEECGQNCDSLRTYYQEFQNKYDSLVVQPCLATGSPETTVAGETLSCCQYKFKTFINTKLNASYTYQQLLALYSKCGILADPCKRPATGPTLCGRIKPAFPNIELEQYSTCNDTTLFAVVRGKQLYEIYRDSVLNSFDDRYLAKCLSARNYEDLTVEMFVSEYHYTLYYYDQAGNLVKTVPPAGVDVSKFPDLTNWSNAVTTARNNRQVLVPDHKLPTEYRYNTLNQMVAEQSPDGGKTEFWYDRLGRIVITRDARQLAQSIGSNKYYSYTNYDQLGRVKEVGQVNDDVSGTAVTDALTRNQQNFSNWLLGLTNKREQITETIYDVAYSGFAGMDPKLVVAQRNLRNRVSYTTYTDGNNTSQFNNATFFTYDIHGNVDTLLQDYGISGYVPNIMNKNDQRFKKIVYRYDLISGKVNHVAYNPRRIDELYHRYSYDADNKLTLAETSTDSVVWERDARYEYYKHGLVARTVIGNEMVQGIDYAYTLQGWFKGVNSIALDSTVDMGQDGLLGGINQNVTRDAIGFNLNYFTGDYSAINANVAPFPGHTAKFPDNNQYRPLFNGNVSSMAVNIRAFNAPKLYNYSYDQLQRLTGMDAWTGFNNATNQWDNPLQGSKQYQERVKYDGNGNITEYSRYAEQAWTGALPMDDLRYSYYPNTNKLRRVRDFGAVYYSTNPPDVQDQSSADNYGYDEIGNLVRDDQEDITNIKWNVYGKIQEINRTPTQLKPVTKIQYTYDAAGNRLSKAVWKTDVTTVDYTWYVRDASGNVMATYTATANPGSLTVPWLNLQEQQIYGTSRLGILSRNINSKDLWFDINNRGLFRGLKQYELTNHLGNVLTTITDKKLGIDKDGDGDVDYFDVDVKSAYDYYPFGMVMPGRSIFGNYRYGFNGKENDNEVKGLVGTQQDYGMRIYDPRLGKFLSVDPLTREFPWNSPYAFAENDVIRNVDLDGAEKLDHVSQYKYDGSWTDYLIWLPNAAGDVYNTVIVDTWNSGVYTIESLKKGEYLKNLKTEVKAIGGYLKQTGINTWKYTWETPILDQITDAGKTAVNPKNWQLAASFYIGSKVPFPLAGKKSNTPLLKPPAKNVLPRLKIVRNTLLTDWGLDNIRKHVSQFGKNVENDIMLDRLNKILGGKLDATDIDLNFYRHELREMELMKKGMSYDDAHAQVLREQNMGGLKVDEYEKLLYTEEAIKAGNAQWEKEVLKNK